MGEIRDISPGQDGYNQTGRQKRVRTSFKHHQLRTMKSYFALNQNPDAKDLKQLSQKTGLSKRVLQVSSVASLSFISCTLVDTEEIRTPLGLLSLQHDQTTEGRD